MRLPVEDIQIPHRGHSYRNTYILKPLFRHPLLLGLAKTGKRRSIQESTAGITSIPRSRGSFRSLLRL